ncbi:MAG: thioredoxin-dependent thiol peroxidase [Candidatus Pacebacteria bacterium]|nr:thioredoxin-dependent thiol peroxidase [Candidatus Paceibacterota bacterium]
MNLSVGGKAPLFSLPDQNGAVHDLADMQGKRLLLYFYPKDDTGGCTAQACAIEAALPDFSKLGVTVWGVSVDPVKSHIKFALKYGLSFTLLSDENKEVVEKYGVWAQKKFMGREYMGTLRTSFLISPEGIIEKIYENVKPETHAADVLADLT